MDETILYHGRPQRESDSGDSGEAPARGPSDAKANGSGRFTYATGSSPLEGYTIKRAIGRGGFGEVYYAITDAGKEVALKLILRNLDVERRGVMHCMNLKSPHLITIHDLRQNEEGDTFVIMEYVSGPSLASVLEKHPAGLPPDAVRHWLRGLIDGVAYLHDHGIVHRDLKPANLFLEEGVVKIGDYGLSKSITHSREPGHSESVGTCHYMAPEIGTGKYHKPIDIYAIGVILYEMITGRVPFDGESVQEVLMKHLTSRPDLRPLSEPYKAIVGRALAKDPNQRPQRAVDLLPPGDEPRAPDVRFIPDGNSGARAGGPTSSPPVDAAARPLGNEKEEVVHISGEEPVFYIGPETVPPKRAQARVRKGLCGAWNGLLGPAKGCKIAAPPPVQRAPQRVVRQAARPAPAPAPAPPAPELPTRRARVAELSTSMLVAAPVALLSSMLGIPMFELFDHRVQSVDPTQFALFFFMILLGSWGALVPGTFWEGREVPAISKRMTYLVAGLIVGLAGAVLSRWAHLGFPSGSGNGPIAEEAFRALRPRLRSEAALAMAMGAYFALAFAFNGFWKLTARDRRSRFRFFPVIAAAAIAGMVGIVLPSPQPWGLLTIGLIASTVQLASPWNREAAAYAEYVHKVGKRKRA
jgi:serine/threonine protein kinase